MKVFRLREKLRDILHTLDDYPANADIKLESNTYFLNGAHYFIGISGYNGGYVSLDNIEDSIIINEEEEEE